VFHHAVADSRQLFQLLRSFGQLFDRFGQAGDKVGSFFVAAIATDDGAVHFEKRRRFVKDARDLLVVHGQIIGANDGRQKPSPSSRSGRFGKKHRAYREKGRQE